MQKIIYFAQLLKFRLSVTVVFSAVCGYILASNELREGILIKLIFGGFLVVGSANTFNQIIERKYDGMMKRTKDRPLPKNNLGLYQSVLFGLITGLFGIYLLSLINPYCSYYWLASIILYVFCYTPMKRFSPISIFIGAIPGAIPYLLGWVAAYPEEQGFQMASGILFAIQFFWQFPHFIAIAWVQHEDYKRAGFKMMIGGEKGSFAAAVSIVTSVLLMIVSVSPFFWKVPNLSISIVGLVICLMFNFVFIFKSINLLIKQNDSSAKKLMIFSFIYLPMIQLLLIVDKYYITI